MSILKRPVLYVGNKGESNLYTLFDSGADFSFINPAQIPNLADPVPLNRSRRLATASEETFIEISERVTLDFFVDDILLSDEFLIAPGLSEDAIIGATTMQKWRIKLDFEEDRVVINPNVMKHRI